MKRFSLTFTITIFLLIAFTAKSLAQRAIQGKITTEKGNTIAHATCTLLAISDSSLIQQTISNEEGFYNLKSVSDQSLLLKVSAAGFTTTIHALTLKAVSQVYNVVLMPAKKLSEVTVSTSKPLIELRPDRTIFNIENSISAAGGDALDALRKTPGVLIMNNEVTIAGSGSVSVMLNGRLQQVSGQDLIQLLRSIPSSNLSKIEVIKTPPAKYDAEGNSGIINLVTKKNPQQGVKGNVVASYNRNTFSGGALSSVLNYRTGKWNFSNNMNVSKEAYLYTNKGSSFYNGQEWRQDIKQGFFVNTGRIQLGAEYTINRSATIAGSYSLISGTTTTDELTTAGIYNKADHLDSSVRTIANSNEPLNRKQTINLNYEWKIDSSGKKLTMDADYYSQVSNRTRNFTVGHYAADGIATGFENNTRTSVRPDLSIKSIKADVEYPLAFANLSFGAKAAFVSNSIDNVMETEEGTSYIVDPSQTNTFIYTEQTQALYLSAQKQVNNRLEFQIGLRGEHTLTKGYSPTLASTTVNEYTKLFPSAFIQYRAGENHSLTLSYNRRIKRPGYNFLNPFRYYYSLNSYTAGNPLLQPSFNNVVRLAYTLKQKYTLSIFSNYVNNYWDRISDVNATEKSVGFTRANIGRLWATGFSLEGVGTIGKWCEVRSSINMQYDDFVLNYQGTQAYASFNGYVDGGASFFLNKSKTFAAEINGYYHTPRQKDYKRWDEMSCINIGVKAMLLDKNLIITLNADDLMKKTFWYQTNSINRTTEYSYDDERCVRMSVTYKFGKKSMKGGRERNASEELQRAN